MVETVIGVVLVAVVFGVLGAGAVCLGWLLWWAVKHEEGGSHD